MPVTKREEVTKKGFCKILRRTLRLWGSLLLVLFQFQFQSHYHSSGWVGVGAYLSLIRKGRGWGGRLFEAGRLWTFSAFRMGVYSNKYSTLIGQYYHGASVDVTIMVSNNCPIIAYIFCWKIKVPLKQLLGFLYTPNCNKVVIEKSKKPNRN